MLYLGILWFFSRRLVISWQLARRPAWPSGFSNTNRQACTHLNGKLQQPWTKILWMLGDHSLQIANRCLWSDQVSFKTIKLYLAGIHFAHTEISLPDPFQEAPLLHLLLWGIKRTVGLSSRQRLPITMSLLRQIKDELARASDLLPSDKLMLWSAFTLTSLLRFSPF